MALSINVGKREAGQVSHLDEPNKSLFKRLAKRKSRDLLPTLELELELEREWVCESNPVHDTREKKKGKRQRK